MFISTKSKQLQTVNKKVSPFVLKEDEHDVALCTPNNRVSSKLADIRSFL